MRNFAASVLFIFAFLVVPQIQAQSVSGSFNKDVIKRGSKVNGKIILDIPDGVHVNSSIPESEFTIPTTLKINGRGIRILKIAYPKGTDRKFEFSETPLNVYEKKAVVNFTIYVPGNFRGMRLKIAAKLNYQACTMEVCYPPKTETVNLTANVK